MGRNGKQPVWEWEWPLFPWESIPIGGYSVKHDIVSFSGMFRLESSLAQKYFMLHRCNVREWEWEGMGIDCTGMGGSGNVKSHSRASL